MSRNPGRYSLLIAVLLVGALFGSAEAKQKRIVDGTQRFTRFDPVIQVGAGTMVDDPCSAGANYPAFDVYDYIDVEGGPDSYYTYIDPGACDGCPTDSQLKVDFVHLSLSFPLSCTQPVSITFVGTRSFGSCPYAPDESKVLAGPFNFNLPGVPSSGAGSAPKFDLPIDPPIVLTHRSFVGMTFTTFGNCVPPTGGAQTNLVIADSTLCEPCRHYNYYVDIGGLFRTDYCAANASNTGTGYSSGPPIIYASGTCGQYVPVLPATWGQLRMRYAKPRRRRRRAVRRPERAAPIA